MTSTGRSWVLCSNPQANASLFLLMKTVHVLSLGAGVQSTCLYLMGMHGYLPFKIEAAVFADTQEEPTPVYKHLQWLKSLGGPTIHEATAGSLGEDLLHGRNSTGQRFASIPAFTKAPGDKQEGRLRRQCSKEYKTEVIEKAIRYQVLGLKPRQRVPAGVEVVSVIGFSLDEAGRAKRMRERMVKKPRRGWSARFPLLEFNMTRADCVRHMERYNIPHAVPRSACTFCPHRTDLEWQLLKDTDPQGWERAIQIDRALRGGAVAQRGCEKPIYIHKSCVPLEEVKLVPKIRERAQFHDECEGVCGN